MTKTTVQETEQKEKKVFPMSSLYTVAFKREKDSPWEAGLAMDAGVGGIIDRYGHKLETVWESRPDFGFSFAVDVILNHNQEWLDEYRNKNIK